MVARARVVSSDDQVAWVLRRPNVRTKKLQNHKFESSIIIRVIASRSSAEMTSRSRMLCLRFTHWKVVLPCSTKLLIVTYCVGPPSIPHIMNSPNNPDPSTSWMRNDMRLRQAAQRLCMSPVPHPPTRKSESWYVIILVMNFLGHRGSWETSGERWQERLCCASLAVTQLSRTDGGQTLHFRAAKCLCTRRPPQIDHGQYRLEMPRYVFPSRPRFFSTPTLSSHWFDTLAKRCALSRTIYRLWSLN